MHEPHVQDRIPLAAQTAQQRTEGLTVLWTQLKGRTEITLDSKFQLLSPLTSRCQRDPSSRGDCAEGERASGSATQQRQPPGVHLSPQTLCRH